MNKFFKSAILIAATIATVSAPISMAAADSRDHRYGNSKHWNRPGGDRPNWNRPNWNRPPSHGRPIYREKRKNNNGNALAAGVIGLAAGALIAGALSQPSQPSYIAPSPSYNPPVNYYPAPPAQYKGSAQPWTKAWYQYCTSRFRSFNSQTGTYRGYDGQDHFCVAN